MGQGLGLAQRLADRGDAACLKALMRASMGPCGRSTAEGGEWLNEILWTMLARQTQLTIDALADLPKEKRQWHLDMEPPVHPRDLNRVRLTVQDLREELNDGR